MRRQYIDMSFGCSAFAWKTLDEKHLWGRNLDFNRLAEGSKVLYLPRRTKFYTCGTSLEEDLVEATEQRSDYAMVGVGSLVLQSTPTLYEGINEKGLMGGQLYYREFAHFEERKEEDKLPLQPAFAVTYFLAKCATVEEVVKQIENNVSFIGKPILNSFPTLHWTFSDATGETIVVEPDKDGVHIYRNTMGVMTNSPSYSWHRLNLLNYVSIRDLDYDERTINGEAFKQCFSGNGAIGLPGDWSSPSRFIRLSFLKQYGVKGKNETEGVSYMFRLFQNVAFPLGMVKVSQPGVITEYDREVVPYDYTIYTSIMCAESLKFYWNSYRNMRIQYVDLNILMNEDTIKEFALDFAEDFKSRN